MDQGVLALVRDRRGLGARIVPREHQYAAVGRRTGVVAVLERVAGAVDARALAVPDAEYAVVARTGQVVHELRAPDRRRGEVLVDAGFEVDAVLGEERLRLPECQVVGAERRAPVAGDEARRVESGSEIAPALHERQPHQCLDACEVDPAGFARVLVVERVARVEGGRDVCHVRVVSRDGRGSRRVARGGSTTAATSSRCSGIVR
jgi:hypothetical protein